MAILINTDTVETVTDRMLQYNKAKRKSEWLVTSSSDVANIDTNDVAPGSIAYTANLAYIAMYDGTQWVAIKGGGS